MPKKTKKEKLLAQRHRHNLPPYASSEGSETKGEGTAVSYRFETPSAVRLSQHTSLVSTEEFGAIKKDLLKTIIITAGIIIGEFLLAQRLPH